MSTMAIIAGRIRAVPHKVPWLVRFFDARLAALEDEHRKLSQQRTEQSAVVDSNPGCTLLDAPGDKDNRMKASARVRKLDEQMAKLVEKRATESGRYQFVEKLCHFIHLY